MILWTPMQLELVFEGLDSMTNTEYNQVDYQGVPVLVKKTIDGRCQIERLMSTDPMDYLKAKYNPGNYI